MPAPVELKFISMISIRLLPESFISLSIGIRYTEKFGNKKTEKLNELELLTVLHRQRRFCIGNGYFSSVSVTSLSGTVGGLSEKHLRAVKELQQTEYQI